MPIYEYRCASCGHEMEAFQKMSDDPLTQCPECEASALQKLISPVGFRLKGGGWYETDFKTSERKKNLAEGDKPKSDKSESKKSESKKSESSKEGKESRPKPKTSSSEAA